MRLIFALPVLLLVACSSKPKVEEAPAPTTVPAAGEIQSDNKDLYDALNAKEVDARERDENGHPSLGTMIFKKSVGGLTCTKSTVVSPDGQPRYSCTKVKSLDAGKIYKSLQADERKSPDSKKGTTVKMKTVGVLTCTKTVKSKKSKPKFNCKIEI